MKNIRNILSIIFRGILPLIIAVCILWNVLSGLEVYSNFIIKTVIIPKATEYIAQTYPDRDFEIVDAYYNFYDNYWGPLKTPFRRSGGSFAATFR